MALTVVMLVGGPLMWWYGIPGRDDSPAVLPMLSDSQRQSVLTYKRRCEGQTDCEKPFACLWDARVSTWRCLASECETDLHCQPGYMCTRLDFSDVPSVRFCLVQGTRKEGERCEKFHLQESEGCQPGLICDSGHCGRPCRLQEPSTCLDGFVCQPALREAVCLPSCLQEGCPPGRECIRIKDEFSICAMVRGQDCRKAPCPAGEACRQVMGGSKHHDVVRMWCAAQCNEKGGKPCPAGSVCSDGYCARVCDEKIPGTCRPGERCTKVFGPAGPATICLVTES